MPVLLLGRVEADRLFIVGNKASRQAFAASLGSGNLLKPTPPSYAPAFEASGPDGAKARSLTLLGTVPGPSARGTVFGSRPNGEGSAPL